MNELMWVFPKIGIPRNGWFIMENPIKMDDLGGPPLFLETAMYFHFVKMGTVSSQSFGIRERTQGVVPGWGG